MSADDQYFALGFSDGSKIAVEGSMESFIACWQNACHNNPTPAPLRVRDKDGIIWWVNPAHIAAVTAG